MGNLDSKFAATSNHYSIIDDKQTNTHLLPSLIKSSLWTVRKVNFHHENKNSLLYEIKSNTSDGNKQRSNTSNKHLKLALNHIKMLKSLRHPNITKYLYSEESPLSTQTNIKCLLICESLRPLSTSLNDLSNEQVICGLYGVINAVVFLHEKAHISHNNVSLWTVYLNGKQTWKLSDFELALAFNELNAENLKSISELKEKASMSPEEEACLRDGATTNVDRILNACPHCIDSYGWAMLAVTVLNKDPTRAAKNTSFEEKYSTNSTTHIIDDDDDAASDNENEDKFHIEQIEPFLDKDGAKRPTMRTALTLNLFELYSNNDNTSRQHESFDPFKLQSLDDLESNFAQLVEYLDRLIKNENNLLTVGQNNAHVNNKAKLSNSRSQQMMLVNEKLIDFLLKPFMFFSAKVKQIIFPSIFVPKEEYVKNSKNFNCWPLMGGFRNLSGDATQSIGDYPLLEPFLDLNKYKALVLPRILDLFCMHSIQIRTVLLEYFPYYIWHINDKDTLKYEILPELLLGLKDKNDHLVALTFSCLSIMVQLLGSETVVGSRNTQNKYFSDNIPKIATEKRATEFKTPNKLSSLSSMDDDLTTSRDETGDNNKILKHISDSMIALHESANDLTHSLSSNQTLNTNNNNGTAKNDYDTAKSSDAEMTDNEWLNDFGWNHHHQTNENDNDSKTNTSAAGKYVTGQKYSSSIISLPGSEILKPNDESATGSSYSTSRLAANQNWLNGDQIGAEYDIKNININKFKHTKSAPNRDEELLENYLNEIAPEIKISAHSDETYKENTKPSANGVGHSEKNGTKVANGWDDDLSDLDNI